MSDKESLRKELDSFVRAKLSKEEVNVNAIYSGVRNIVGSDNTDGTMLNFAANMAVGEIKKAKDAGKELSKSEFQKQVDLVVNWALIKIKGKDSSEINEIGAGNSKDVGYGTGGDTITLKDFNLK